MTTPTITDTPKSAPQKLKRDQKHTSAWTTERRTTVESYVSYLQTAMRLQDWTITIDWEKPSSKDALATVTPFGDSRHACVRLSPEFLDETPKMRTQVLIHELTHCHLFALDTLARDTVQAVTTKKAAAVFDLAFNAQLESTVDAIADTLVELLPPLTLH